MCEGIPGKWQCYRFQTTRWHLTLDRNAFLCNWCKFAQQLPHYCTIWMLIPVTCVATGIEKNAVHAQLCTCMTICDSTYGLNDSEHVIVAWHCTQLHISMYHLTIQFSQVGRCWAFGHVSVLKCICSCCRQCMLSNNSSPKRLSDHTYSAQHCISSHDKFTLL